MLVAWMKLKRTSLYSILFAFCSQWGLYSNFRNSISWHYTYVHVSDSGNLKICNTHQNQFDQISVCAHMYVTVLVVFKCIVWSVNRIRFRCCIDVNRKKCSNERMNRCIPSLVLRIFPTRLSCKKQQQNSWMNQSINLGNLESAPTRRTSTTLITINV